MTATTCTPVTTGSGRALDDLLDRVAEQRPGHADRARRELAETLAGTRGSAVGDLAWRASCLTPTRFPVEVAVSSARDELRTVVDVLAPEADRGLALGTAIGLAGRFGSSPPAARTEAVLHDHQRGAQLRFGAWLGSRHTAGASSHKLYVELDGGDRSWRLLDALVPGARRILAGVGRLRFLGLVLDGSGAVEVYVRPPLTDEATVRACLGRAGLGASVEALLGALGDTLAARNHALSVSFAHGRAVAAAVFTFAHHRYRRDHRVRERMLSLARSEGWPSASLYEAVSRPLAEPRPLARPVHTALSEVVLADTPGVLHHVGLAPPAARP
jgi:hypothetical protein